MIKAEQILQQRYCLKQKLGQNSGRQTWLAEDISVEPAEKVVIKILMFDEQFQWDNLKLFEREVKVIKHLSHPNIPQYRDYFVLDDNQNCFALVQEHIPGSSFKQLIENQQRFTEDELKKISETILEILNYLHTLNPQVIHRDIKPSNLILNEDNKVYLIDFGAVQDSLTKQNSTFTVVGSYGYAPVEQFGGKTVPASDLYGLGATLIHLSTGVIPADLPQKNMRIQFRDKVNLSPNFTAWIQKLTEPDVEQRFSSAVVALEALNSDFSEIPQVEDSRIQLKKSANSLEIEIPSQGVQWGDIGAVILFVICLGATISTFTENPSCWFNLLVGFIFGIYTLSCLFDLLLFRIFGEIFITLNPNIFLIKWKLFRFTYQRLGKTADINHIGKDYTWFQVDKKHLEMISMQTSNKKYNFGAFINDAERQWLRQEIKSWLGI